ncbi:MAG: ABC transporter ATP-binding protein [Atopobiaceae bacterium]
MISIRDVSVGYGGSTVLRVDSLDVRPGEVVALVGRNGCGKSTLLRALVGLLPHEGSILLDGTQVQQLGHRARARVVAYLPQVLRAADLSVEALVAHGRYARIEGITKTLGSDDVRIVEEAMRTADVERLRDRSLVELSGGERQRAYLAMVVAQQARYLLLDEPGTYMDAEHRLELSGLLTSLARSGKGLLVTSHDLPEAFSVADRVCLVSQGRVVACDKPDVLCGQRDVVRAAMGVSVVREDTPGALYPYALAR